MRSTPTCRSPSSPPTSGRDRRPTRKRRRGVPAQAADAAGAGRLPVRRAGAAAKSRYVTASSAIALDELELDALTELVNIGVSRAAASLREMVGEQVMLSVPSVAIVTRDRRREIIGEREASRLVAVHQVFEGDIIRPRAADLSGDQEPRAGAGGHRRRAAAGGHHRAGAGGAGRDRQHHSERLPGDHRQHAAAQPEDVAARDPARPTSSFSTCRAPRLRAKRCCSSTSISRVQQREIRGYIAMLMDMPALAALKVLIGEFIERTGRAHARARMLQLDAHELDECLRRRRRRPDRPRPGTARRKAGTPGWRRRPAFLSTPRAGQAAGGDVSRQRRKPR